MGHAVVGPLGVPRDAAALRDTAEARGSTDSPSVFCVAGPLREEVEHWVPEVPVSFSWGVRTRSSSRFCRELLQ